MKKRFKKIFVAGTFDHFHIGHQYFLWSAHQLAEEMVVIVARDETVFRIKGQNSTYTEVERLDRVKKENFPNATIRLGREDRDFMKTIEEESPDALYFGFDQKTLRDEQLSLLEDLEVLRANPFFPEFFKSSKFRS